MSKFFKNIFKRSAPRLRSNFPIADSRIAAGEPENASTATTAMMLASVYRCVNYIADSVAVLPLRHESKQGGVFRPVDDRLTRLLSVEPNEWTSAFDFWRQVIISKLLYGRALPVPCYDSFGELKRLVLPTPGTAGPMIGGRGMYQVYDLEQGVTGEFEESEIVNIKGMSLDGQECLSVIGYAARTTSIAATADRNTLDTFANGGATMGMITNDVSTPGYGELQTEALQAMAENLSLAIKRHDRITAVGGRASYVPFSMTAADMQFLESRKFTVLEICRFFGVDPSFVFEGSASNYKSAEMATQAFLTGTLNPILRQIENELDRKLLGGSTRERIRFDRAELYATNLDTKMKYIEKRIQTGTSTINEARISLGMPPIEGGDVLLASANLKPIQELTKTDGTKNPL
ncbi:MAG: phage portal protein [Muribaculaceae bacterium]|nr:phage portal protein [Muribaculaceae bacterium]